MQLDDRLRYLSALPSKLSEKWLLRIVRDLRKIESGDPIATEDWAFATGPIYLTGLILAGRLSAKGLPEKPKISLENLMNLVRRYHRIAEREVVSRQLGIPLGVEESDFLQSVDRHIDEEVV